MADKKPVTKMLFGVPYGRTDAKAETPVLWPPHVKSWLTGKDSDDGRDWGQEEKGTTEDEMAGWHHRLHGHECGWTPGVGDGQGGLVCCSPWGHKESDMPEQLHWTEMIWTLNKPNYICLVKYYAKGFLCIISTLDNSVKYILLW